MNPESTPRTAAATFKACVTDSTMRSLECIVVHASVCAEMEVEVARLRAALRGFVDALQDGPENLGIMHADILVDSAQELL